MVIKNKVRDQVEVEEVSNEAYQVYDLILLRLVVDTDIPSDLLSASRKVDIIELPS